MDRDELLELIDRAAREGWTELDLRNQGLTELPRAIDKLTQLRSLNLGWNELMTLPLEIGRLTQLRKLYLGGNGLTTLPSEIGQLTKLQRLSLGGNKLAGLPSEIGHLTQLQRLRLGSNELTDLPPQICQLTRVHTLGLSNNHLMTLPSEIGQLSQLQYVHLGSNNLTALPPAIRYWTQLLSLNLDRNVLTDLPSEIGQLTRLQKLDLSHNRLDFLPLEISRLSQLLSLNLEWNDLTTLFPEVGLLSQLRSLGLRSNQLTALPKEIGQLTALRELDLAWNDLTALPPEIGQLSQLQYLNLWDNQLRSLPSEIGHLTQLQELCLGYDWMKGDQGNQLTELPPEIGQLARLQKLDLMGNQLTALPPEVGKLTALQELDLRENPDFPLPPEILAQTDDPQAIIDTYFEYLAGRSRSLSEVKMVLVGQGSVGKTSLVTCLLDGSDAFDPNETKTKGIDTRRWSLPLPTSTEDGRIRVNVWDFGGQEIMHATHQFFLTRRTLYLLVLDNRLTEAENRLDYWLQIIRSFGGDSPVILVGNKIDQQPLDIDQIGIRDKYPVIKAIVETSCLTGEGIDALQATIAELAPTLPHVFDELLATWFDVKAELEEMDADYIPYSQYTQMCQEAGVTKEQSQRTLLGFLHDLGIVLHFPDPRLETTNILNPEWVTQGVYRILNSHALFHNGGVLTRELLTQILEGPKYPRDKHMFIVDMMRKFELCYPFPGQAHTYLVPDLLPKEEQYTGDWNDALAFQVHYNVLPSSVISRFIVCMHHHIHQNTVWRTGVLLSCEGNKALVKADLADHRVLIRVRGPAPGRRDLLTRIREQFDAIHHTIQGLQVEEKVPLPGHPELPPVDYSHLRNLESAGIERWIPEGLTEPINVRRLLNGVESPSARRRSSEEKPTTDYKFYGSRINHIGDVNTQSEERNKQMDFITGAIVAALAAGVASGAGEVGKEVVVDAYGALKAAIKKKYGAESKVAQAVSAVEDEPDFEPNQQALAGRVEQVDAAEDPELQELAQKLLEALEETSQGKEALSKYNIQIDGGQVGVIGDHTEVKGGIHFGSSKE